MNIQERIEALETEFNEKIKTLKAEAQQVDEFPQFGDDYWYIGKIETGCWGVWEDSSVDKHLKSIGNVFHTREEAEFAVEKLKIEAELRKFSVPIFKGRYYIYMKTEDGKLGFGVNGHYKSQGTIYFESEEKGNEAIKSVGADRIKKYIFGVED